MNHKTWIPFEEQKKVMLEILAYVDSVCENLNVKYCLGYGSALGAVRHSGMIPWDDDIDIYMLRDDYERFKQTFNNNHNHYKLHSYDIDGYPIPYTKISDERTYQIEVLGARLPAIGINVDIFPVDNVPNDYSTFKKQMDYRISLYNKLYTLYFPFFRKHSPSGYFKIIYYRLKYRRGLSICRKLDELAKNAAHEATGFLYEQIMGLSGHHIYKQEWFDSFPKILFEGKEYPIMRGYKEYLSAQYGNDYMELPPIEKRHRHESRAYFK